MAMKYGGEYRADRIRGPHLDRLADELEFGPAAVRRRAREACERILAARATARDHLPEAWRGEDLLDSIDKLITGAADELRCAAAEPR
jgi:hypothetical protein